MTRWLVAETVSVLGGKIEHNIPERPLLHVCCNQDHFGDVNVDIRPEVHPDKVADVTQLLPFPPDSFGSSFGDFPWVNSWKWRSAKAIKQMLRVAPVAYTVSPWLLGSSEVKVTSVHVSLRPGINNPILFVRYERAGR